MTPTFRFLPGSAFGVRQSTMLLTIDPGKVDPVELAGLESWIGQLTGLVDLHSQENQSNARCFVEWVARGIVRVQQGRGIPLPDTLSVRSLATGPDGQETFELALPWFFRGTALLAAQWFLAVLEERDWLREWAAEHRSGARCPDPEQLETELDSAIPEISRLRLARAALSMDVPVADLGFGVFLLGQGCFSQRLDATATENTGSIGVRIAGNKVHTAALLRRAGLPVPRHRVAASLEQARTSAVDLGYPVVVKPWDRERGEGVAAGLKTESELDVAFSSALQVSPNLLVERHHEGFTHRLTVFRGKVIKVTQRRPGGVRGDGMRSVTDLVASAQGGEDMQSRVRRWRKTLLELDAEARELLAAAGLTPESVPAEGRFVPLRRRDNVSTGGSNILVDLDSVASANLRLATEAARVLRLDLAGIDLLSDDISLPWYENGAVICEVNAKPQLGEGTSPGIYQAILRELLGEKHRIPVHILVTNPAGSEFTTSARHWALSLDCNGFAADREVWLDQARIGGRHASAFAAATALVEHSACRAALCQLSLDDALQSGLPSDRVEQVLLHSTLRDHPQLDRLLALVRPHAAKICFTDEPR